jgi:hypothetical protein
MYVTSRKCHSERNGDVEVNYSDSKLFSGFPWPIIFKPEKTKLNCLRNMKM